MKESCFLVINIIIKQHRTSEKYDESVPSIIVIIVEKNLYIR